MYITVEKQHEGFVNSIPPKLEGHFVRCQLYAWPDSNRFPISLGVVMLPVGMNLDAFQESINASL